MNRVAVLTYFDGTHGLKTIKEISNRIWDRESERFFTVAELEQEYILQRQMHQTEAATFDEYLENITSPNGACEWEYARGN